MASDYYGRMDTGEAIQEALERLPPENRTIAVSNLRRLLRSDPRDARKVIRHVAKQEGVGYVQRPEAE